MKNSKTPNLSTDIRLCHDVCMGKLAGSSRQGHIGKVNKTGPLVLKYCIYIYYILISHSYLAYFFYKFNSGI